MLTECDNIASLHFSRQNFFLKLFSSFELVCRKMEDPKEAARLYAQYIEKRKVIVCICFIPPLYVIV